MKKNNTKKEATVNYIKHSTLAYVGAAGAGVGAGFIHCAVNGAITTNPVANLAIAAGGSIATAAGLSFAFDQTIKSYTDIKELIEIEETARRLSDLE